MLAALDRAQVGEGEGSTHGTFHLSRHVVGQSGHEAHDLFVPGHMVYA
jgi:hypothetical protein